jgi:hypothetical protein
VASLQASTAAATKNGVARQGLSTATDGLVGSVARRSGGADWLRIRGSINAISRAQLRPGQCSRWGLPVDYCTVDFVASSTFEGSRLLSSLETWTLRTRRQQDSTSAFLATNRPTTRLPEQTPSYRHRDPSRRREEKESLGGSEERKSSDTTEHQHANKKSYHKRPKLYGLSECVMNA